MTWRPWHPEFPVDATLAARLAARLVPETAGIEPERVGEGWDNDVWRFGLWTLRFPRRPLGADLIRVEAAVLPALAPHLPVAVPFAEHVGEPGPDHPAPYLAHRFVPGTTVDRARLERATRHRLAPQVAGFLRALHDLPLAAAPGAPIDEHKRAIDARRRMIGDRLPRLSETRYGRFVDATASAVAAIDARPDERLVICHGDLYPRHLLVDATGDLCGVIDWGDVRLSHPGIDLSIAFSLLPPSARPAFFSVYGPIDPGSEALARMTALHYATALGLYALDVGDRSLADDAEVIFAHATAA